MNQNMKKNDSEKNSKVEIIQGDPKIALKTIAWLLILTLVLNMVYNMVDRVWISGLGADPLAAIGFVTPIFIIIGGIANGFGAGVNSLISRYIGAKNKHQASNSAIHGIIIALILSIIIPAILLPCIKELLIVMGANAVLDYAIPYASIIIIGSFTLIFNGILSSQLRAEGDVKRATIALILTGIINIVIDPIFIYALNMGVIGAAIATILSALVATILMLYWILIKQDTYVDVKRSEFEFSKTILKQLIAVAVPGSIEQLIISLITIIMNAVLAMISTTATVAGFSAAMSIIQVGMMVPVGIATAAITVSGVAYGARDIKRVDSICNYSIKLSMILVIILIILMELFAPQLALLFSYTSSSAGLSSIITDALRILCLFLLALPIGLCCSFIFQGMGKGVISLILTTCREFLFILISIYILVFTLNMGPDGAYLSLAIGAFLGSLLGLIVFKGYIKKIDKLEGYT